MSAFADARPQKRHAEWDQHIRDKEKDRLFERRDSEKNIPVICMGKMDMSFTSARQ